MSTIYYNSVEVSSEWIVYIMDGPLSFVWQNLLAMRYTRKDGLNPSNLSGLRPVTWVSELGGHTGTNQRPVSVL